MIRSRIFPNSYYNRHQAARGQELVNTKDSYISESDNNDMAEQDDDLVEIEDSMDGSVWMKVRSDVELSKNISINSESV